MTENKILDATCFFYTPEFNRLTKLVFDENIKPSTKHFATEVDKKTALDLGGKTKKNGIFYSNRYQ